MPPRYDDPFRNLIANCIRIRASTAEIVDRIRVSSSLVRRYYKNIELFSVHNPTPHLISH